MKRFAPLALLLLLALPATAHARRVGVFPMRLVGPFEYARVSPFDALFVDQLGRDPRNEVFGVRELGLRGGKAKAELVATCAELRCSAELGRSLGLDLVFTAELVDLGGTYVLSAVLVDTARAAPVVRATRVVMFAEQLTAAAMQLAEELTARCDLGATERRPRVAVLPTVTNPTDPAMAAATAAMISGEFADDDTTEVLAAADVIALLAESGRSAQACAEATASCMAELGGALGADRVVTSEVSRAGGEWVVGLSIVELRRAEALHRSVQRVANAGNVPDAVRAALREAGLRVEVEAKPPVPAFAGELVARSDRRDRAAWVVVGVGATALVGAGLLGWLSNDEMTDANTLKRDASRMMDDGGDAWIDAFTESRRLRQESELDRARALGLSLSGLTAIGFGVVYLLTDDPQP